MKARSRFSSTPTKHFSHRGAQESAPWTRAAVLRELKALANPRVRAKMAYFGIDVPKAHGISAPVLHSLAKRIGKNHRLPPQLWRTGVHETRILATPLGEATKTAPAVVERWARDFDACGEVDTPCLHFYSA